MMRQTWVILTAVGTASLHFVKALLSTDLDQPTSIFSKETALLSMSLFKKSSKSGTSAASSACAVQAKCYEKLLSLRISLQKCLDLVNTLPITDSPPTGDSMDEVAELSSKSLKLMTGMMGKQCAVAEKRKAGEMNESDSDSDNDNANKSERGDEYYDRILKYQKGMAPSWQSIVNKWHSRLNYGSEKAQSKMRVFNRSLFEQVDILINDKKRCVEKSRVPLMESKRSDKPEEDSLPIDQNPATADSDRESSDSESDEDANSKKKKKGKDVRAVQKKKSYDMEVYDDRPFYTLLLKTFIASASHNDGQGVNSRDLEELKKYKRSKVVTDRKASKGRKIRYMKHKKMENFMFPVHVQESATDSNKLFRSLFQ